MNDGAMPSEEVKTWRIELNGNEDFMKYLKEALIDMGIPYRGGFFYTHLMTLAEAVVNAKLIEPPEPCTWGSLTKHPCPLKSDVPHSHTDRDASGDLAPVIVFFTEDGQESYVKQTVVEGKGGTCSAASHKWFLGITEGVSGIRTTSCGDQCHFGTGLGDDSEWLSMEEVEVEVDYATSCPAYDTNDLGVPTGPLKHIHGYESGSHYIVHGQRCDCDWWPVITKIKESGANDEQTARRTSFDC